MADKHSSTEKKDSQTGRENFPIVALCASAGGLNAFQEFFDAMPTNSGMAFIVVQHLANQQESILHELIQRHTSITVQPIHDEMPVEKDNVYVLPAGYEIYIWDGHLRLTPRDESAGWPRTIDHFLNSLAQDQGERTAVIMLSGVGNDGAEGSRAVKQEGGMILAQDDSAVQSGMPSSVIDAGLADAILKPEQMPDALLDHFSIDIQHMLPSEDLTERVTDEDIDHVIRQLQSQTKRNFTDYKRSTLRRQIARRMGSYQLSTPEEYLNYISQNSAEAENLAQYLLINVTSFFRDAESFDVLKHRALLPALSKMNIDTIFRAWVPGCASGQEAISIAILIHECLRELDMPDMEVRIFATDANRDILRQPRTGLYPYKIIQEISTERLQDHFIEEENGYRVRSHITRMIIWSEHNLVEHPPFSNMHLISCRNVLIYFQRRLQERVFALFHFALQPEGILFLGSSETLPQDTSDFTAIDSKHKIFQRSDQNEGSWLRLDQPLFIRVPDYAEVPMPATESPRNKHEDYELDIIKNALAEHYASTCVLVDEQYRVRYTYGEVDLYLRIVPGRDGQNNILDMSRQGLDVELTIALHQAFDGDDTVTRQGVWVKTSEDERIINLVVRPIKIPAVAGRQRLVIFELSVPNEKLQEADVQIIDGEEGTTIRRLREELLQTQKALQNVTQALQAKSEELTSSMEEIRSANEEIQTTNEELRTSKEELESMNEELNTLNTQLTDQNFELSRANNTLHNFLQSADVGIIFLNQDLFIREYTLSVTNIFGLRPGDKGRPLAEVVNRLKYDSLITDAEGVLDTLNNLDREVATTDGHWYNLSIRPYRTTNNIIDGLVLTFTEVTTQKQAQATLDNSKFLQQVFNTIDNCLIKLDQDLRVIGANQAFYNLFETTEDATIGEMLYHLGNGQWDIPDLRRLLTEILPHKMVVYDYTVTHDFPKLGTRTMHINARHIAEVDRVLLVITDISEIKS